MEEALARYGNNWKEKGPPDLLQTPHRLWWALFWADERCLITYQLPVGDVVHERKFFWISSISNFSQVHGRSHGFARQDATKYFSDELSNRLLFPPISYSQRRRLYLVAGGRPTRPHLTWPITPQTYSPISFHLGCAQDRCSATLLPVRYHPPAPHGPSPLIFSPLHLHLLHSSFTPRTSAHSGSQWASFSPLQSPYPGGYWASPRPMLSLQRSGTHRLGRLSMHGVRPMVPLPLLRDSHPSRLPAAGSIEMLHTSLTCSIHQGAGVLRLGTNTFDPLVRGLPLQPRRAPPLKGPALERGRFPQFNCNGILHCHAELLDFLHRHQVLFACVQETKLGVNSSLNEFTGYATVRRDRPTGGGGGGLVLSFTTPSHKGCLTMTYFLMMTRRKFWQSRLTSG